MGALARLEAVAGELVSPAEDLVATFALSLGSGSSVETVRTYRGACERFVGWLVERHGPGAGPEHLTLASVAAYEDSLAGVGLSLATIRKDRSAINRMLCFLAEHELMDPAQARLARSRHLPTAHHGERERPKALTDVAYRRLVTEAEATVASDQLLGWRDVAIVRLLGDAGLRIEELLALDRADFLPKRKGARLRAIRVQHGKGNRQRIVELTPAATATAAVRRWDDCMGGRRRGSSAAEPRRRWRSWCWARRPARRRRRCRHRAGMRLI